jgi:TolB-like protein
VTRFGPWADTPAPRMSVVVLPFRNLGADRGQDYLADAISDDLTTDLSHLPGSTVIARESADTYKGRAVAAQSIGRALKVRYLLEGSLRGEGATLHINAQLIDAPSGAHLWASAFDVPRGGLDGAREEIVRHLASVLDFTLVQIESARSLHERPRNPDAVDLYLRARSQLDRDDSLAGLAAAQALLEQAITVGPDFSDAQAQLALVLLRKINGYDDPDEWRDHARAAAMIARALAVAPRNPLAITARGELAREDARCDTARPSFSLALSLDPDQTQARVGLAECDHDLGRMQDMIDDLKQVIRIDPAAPNIAPRQNRIGLGYLMLGNLAEATAWFERARAAIADPAAAPASLSWQEWNRLYLIAAAWESGDHARATSLYTDYARQSPHRTVWQLGAYDTHAMAVLPGRVTFFKALAAAGMPLYADDNLPGRRRSRAPRASTPRVCGLCWTGMRPCACSMSDAAPPRFPVPSWSGRTVCGAIRTRCWSRPPQRVRRPPVRRPSRRSWSWETAPAAGRVPPPRYISLQRATTMCSGTGAARRPGSRRAIPPKIGGSNNGRDRESADE